LQDFETTISVRTQRNEFALRSAHGLSELTFEVPGSSSSMDALMRPSTIAVVGATNKRVTRGNLLGEGTVEARLKERHAWLSMAFVSQFGSCSPILAVGSNASRTDSRRRIY
jgi:hypothetical protein